MGTGGTPKYYPLFTKERISSFLGFYQETADVLSKTYSDVHGFSMASVGEELSSSYFTSQRHGLQGLGFLYASWNGAQIHCGYDKDCASGAKPQDLRMRWGAKEAAERAKSCKDAGG